MKTYTKRSVNLKLDAARYKEQNSIDVNCLQFRSKMQEPVKLKNQAKRHGRLWQNRPYIVVWCIWPVNLYVFGWHRSPIEVVMLVSESVSESTTFHHLPVGVSWWNLHHICVLVISCNSPKGKVIGQKVKGHGLKRRSFFAIFG